MRTIKTLGIATAMALALIAFAGAGAASANNFKAAVEPETWNGGLSGEKHSLVIGGEYATIFNCSGVAFSGETKAKTVGSLTVSPSLTGCSHAGKTGSWKMNGCKFRFNPGPGPGLVGTMDITDCEKPMRYEVFGTPCFVEIGNQNGLGKVEYENITVGGVPALKVIAKLTGIKYTQSEQQCTGSPNGTFSDGTYRGDWIVKGASIPGGAAVAAEIQSTPLTYTRFSAEESPATLIGVNPEGIFRNMLDLAVNERVECLKPSYNVAASPVPTETITVTPSFHECFLGGEGGYAIPDENLTAGGCSYRVYAKSGFDIFGATCAANPITVTVPGCVFKVGPQSSATGPTFNNEGSGKTRKVRVTNNPQKGMTYTAEGAGCIKQGTISEASVKVPGVLFSAKNASGAAQGLWRE